MVNIYYVSEKHLTNTLHLSIPTSTDLRRQDSSSSPCRQLIRRRLWHLGWDNRLVRYLMASLGWGVLGSLNATVFFSFFFTCTLKHTKKKTKNNWCTVTTHLHFMNSTFDENKLLLSCQPWILESCYQSLAAQHLEGRARKHNCWPFFSIVMTG